jgi:DNA gyrase/topoisomerase IV subunit A
MDIVVRFKDTRLLRSRVLPALYSTDSYQFYALNLNDKLQLFKLKELFHEWLNFRLNIWSRRIQDILAQAKRDYLELQTQLSIIRNMPKWSKALQLSTLAEVKEAVRSFIDPEMFDYALDLPNRKILKLNEKALLEKMAEIQGRLEYWQATTPQIKLEEQILELIEFYREQSGPLTTTQTTWKALPDFSSENQVAQTQWVIVSSEDYSINTEAPTRGRGFASIGICNPSNWFSVISSGGWIEQHNLFHLPKRLSYLEWQKRPIAAFGDDPGLLVALDVKGALHIRENLAMKRTESAFTKSTQVKRALFVTKNDRLLIRYQDGRHHSYTYQELLKKSTTRATEGYLEYWGVNNPCIDISLIHKDGVIYTEHGVKFLAEKPKLKDVRIFDVADSNFVVLKAGNRQFLNRKQLSEVLETVDQVFGLH